MNREFSARITPENLYRLRRSDLCEISKEIMSSDFKRSNEIKNEIARNFAILITNMKGVYYAELDTIYCISVELEMVKIWNDESIKTFLSSVNTNADILQAVFDGMSEENEIKAKKLKKEMN